MSKNFPYSQVKGEKQCEGESNVLEKIECTYLASS